MSHVHSPVFLFLPPPSLTAGAQCLSTIARAHKIHCPLLCAHIICCKSLRSPLGSQVGAQMLKMRVHCCLMTVSAAAMSQAFLTVKKDANPVSVEEKDR